MDSWAKADAVIQYRITAISLKVYKKMVNTSRRWNILFLLQPLKAASPILTAEAGRMAYGGWLDCIELAPSTSSSLTKERVKFQGPSADSADLDYDVDSVSTEQSQPSVRFNTRAGPGRGQLNWLQWGYITRQP